MNTLLSLPTIDQEFFDDQDAMRLYAIAVCPSWKHWHATECPRPIMDLIARKYSGVTVERVSGWKGKTNFAPDSEEVIDLADLPQPVFRIGLSDSQAEDFVKDLQALSAETGEKEEEFYFLHIDRKQYPTCLSGDEVLAEIDLNDVDLSCLSPNNC